MPRIKLSLPEEFTFRMERSVGLSDVNYAKHLDSLSMVEILHEARLQYLASLGFTEEDIFGLGMVVTDLSVDFRSESFANDVLIIDVGIGKVNRYGVDICLRVTNSALDSVVCVAKMGVVLFDFDKHQMVSVPRQFKQLVQSSEAQAA
ncbi:MAG: thioesterase family protein [Gammaproteobacteria bacterium]|nr:thioesterase family protein [Gammaproteobacteria bacterium]MCY3687984.1 thioesterase family protein [Gammaproteobacteria bacterium]MDE0478166.1 thioesterase family protein [Gammaproteobacteria bacterium]MDE0508193.1 thioesterase family protein [Gammaproteobacteria bacterium]MXX06594.1 acyl-CoA thioesterase [Gammaproteobacteria bacterium]